MIDLRPAQTDVVEGVRESYRKGFRAPLAVAPTGFGKTVVFAFIAATTAARGNTAVILVHRVELVRQTVEKLMWAGVRCGVIHPDYKRDLQAPIQVASVQTIVNRLEKLPFDFDLVITDEAHHATAGSWRKIIDHYSRARMLGVTATPIRTDGAGLNEIFDDIVMAPQVSEIIADGYLVAPLVYAPPSLPDFTGIKVDTEKGKKEVEIRINKPTITGDAVAHYTKLCPGAPAVAFCVSVEHAEDVAAEFRAAGYRAASVDGSTDPDERKRILDGLEDGTFQVVASCSIISEGTDIPAITCAILLRPTESLSLYIQQAGRSLRPVWASGNRFDLSTREGRLNSIAASVKPNAIILDHVGNCFRHGMPDEDRDWTLEGRKKKGKKGDVERSVRVIQCPECYMCHPPAPACISCGFEYPVQSREVEHVDGELSAITPEMKKAITMQRKREVYAAKTLEDLIEVGRARGYAPGWATSVHKARNKKVTGV